jgi:hypothetical protein
MTKVNNIFVPSVMFTVRIPIQKSGKKSEIIILTAAEQISTVATTATLVVFALSLFLTFSLQKILKEITLL